MPTPVHPVVEGLEPFEIVFGKDQEGVDPLPALRRTDGMVASRWALTDQERDDIFRNKFDIFVHQYTYFNPPMPLSIEILPRTILPGPTKEAMSLDVELNNRIKSGQFPIDEARMLVINRRVQISEQPEQFANAEVYYDTLELLRMEWSLRGKSQARMDFSEWQIAEIVRLRKIALESVKNL